MIGAGSAADRVIVVGGGVAGLVLARDVAVGGRRVTVVEASERLGGQVQPLDIDGLRLDAGAESFATRRGTVAALAAELGLGDDVVDPAPLGSWVQPARGPAHPLPAAGVFGIPGTPLARDVIDAIGLRAALRAELDALLPSPIGARSRSLGELVRRRMGAAVVERLVAPVTRGVHSAHPDDLEVERIAPDLQARIRRSGTLAAAVRGLRAASPAGSQVQGIRGGIARLVEALAADLDARGVEVRTGAPGDDLDLFGVTVGGERLRGRVVTAAPRLGAQGPAAGASGSTAVHLVTLVVHAPDLHPAPRGTGVLVADGAGVRAKALTHLSAKWPWIGEAAGERDVLRLSFDQPVPDRVAIDDAARLTGVGLVAEQVRALAHRDWTRAVPSAVEGALLRVGEEAAGGGLANVVHQAREQADSILRAEGA